MLGGMSRGSAPGAASCGVWPPDRFGNAEYNDSTSLAQRNQSVSFTSTVETISSQVYGVRAERAMSGNATQQRPR